MTTKRLKRPRDPIQLGKLIVDIATGQVDDREQAVVDRPRTAVARKAGQIGGPARAAKLSPIERKAIAENAARARWKRAKSGQS
jgi:hypothetical protein